MHIERWVIRPSSRGLYGLALLATAVLLAPGEAQARDECGTWSTSATTHTCSDAAYASGIRYDAADGWGNGIAGDITLTVTGGSATAISSAAAAASNSWGSGIVLRTAHHATDTRTVALTVGSGANAVRITQTTGTLNAGFDNTGVVIHHRAAGASPTTVILGSGVDIGTMAAPMKRSGVHVLVERADNTADHTITSAADIYSAGFGILMDPRGSGNVMVTNSGSIVNAAVTGGTTGNADGIRILDWTGTRGNERPATATTTVTNSGSISVSQAGGSGIRVDAEGLGLYKTVNSGTVSATSTASHGIFVDASHHWGAAGSEAVEIENSGAITTAGTSTHGIYVETYDGSNPQGRGDGNLAITNSGSISSANAALLVNSNAGDTTVKHTGGSITSTADDGIRVQQGGTGAVTVESGADVTAENYGIRVLGGPTQAATTVTVAVAVGVTTRTNEPQVTIAAGTTTTTYATLGDVSVTHSGGEIEATTESGIWIQQAGADATVTSSADVTAKKYGIFVTNDPALATVAIAAGVTTRTWSNTGAVSVTHSGGDIEAETESGIHARNSAGNADAVTVAVTGGSVSTEGQSKAAVAVLQRGTGDAVASVSSGATLTSKHNAGIYANLDHAANAAGQVKITQGGTIAGRKGVYARVGRFSAVTISAGVTTSVLRAEAAGPVIDIAWTGGFTHGTTATVAGTDDDRFLANGVAHAVAFAQEVEAEKAMRPADRSVGTGFLRYGSPAGIEAQVMSWREVMTQVAKGDDPGAFADAAAVTALFDDSATDATKARAAAIIAAFRAALANEDLDTIPGAAAIDTDGTTGLSDDEIETYLSVDDADRRTLLRNVLAQGFTDAEKAVLRAAATNDGLTDAVLDAALPAGATDREKMTYRDAVRALLNRRNVGDIRVAMTGGSIAAPRGDGIRAYYATPHAMNGAISVTVAAGATVDVSGNGDMAGMAGIYVANAGAMGTGAERILKQTVTVNGMVTGGSDAAVHLVGGGRLTVGQGGKVRAGSSGTAILVNDPGRSEIVINGEVWGGAGARAAVDVTGGGRVEVGLMGRVHPNGATKAIGAYKVSPEDTATTRVVLRVPDKEVDGRVSQEQAEAALKRVGGADKIDGDGIEDNQVTFAATDRNGTTGMTQNKIIGESVDISDLPSEQKEQEEEEQKEQEEEEAPRPIPAGNMECDMATDKRCRLYEALPSVLLVMNDLPTWAERMSAARDAQGGWARVETAGGKWKADRSTESDVAWDHRRHGVRAGMDFAVGEGGRAGVSVHGLRGSAEMTKNGGEVDLSGGGVGVNATAAMAGDVHVDAQAAVTWYDMDVESALRSSLKKGAGGMGYALGVEVGRRMPVADDVFLTPHGGLLWSKVSLDDFTDSLGTRVSVEDADSLRAALGVSVEKVLDGDGGSRLFGSLDVEQEFKEETAVKVQGSSLKASAEKTRFRLGIGGVHAWDEGRYALQGSLGYTARGGGGDNRDVGGGLSFVMRF